MVKKIYKKDKPAKVNKEGVGYKSPPKKHQFKKGVAPNPTGINKPKAVRQLQALTEKTLQDAIEKVLGASKKELQAMLKDSEMSLGQRIIIKAALKAEKDDSFHQFDSIVTRAIGVVKTKIDHSSEDGSMTPGTPVNFYIPDNKREVEK